MGCQWNWMSLKVSSSLDDSAILGFSAEQILSFLWRKMTPRARRKLEMNRHIFGAGWVGISLQEFGKTFPVVCWWRHPRKRGSSAHEKETPKKEEHGNPSFSCSSCSPFTQVGLKVHQLLDWQEQTPVGWRCSQKILDGNGSDRRRHQAWQCAGERVGGKRKKKTKERRRAH